jgi:GntR family negative regulator for fad regulon and positive regulator of fabA
LAELIGGTRTTLREVLQRLARDGWLTIQHGKPTKVNNFWETCGLNILETLARLDQEGIPELVDNLLAARTNLSAVFIRGAIRHNPQASADIIARYKEVEEEGLAFAQFDYQMTHDLALASNNNVFVLMMNGFRGLYSRIGGFYFSHQQARDVAKRYYADLLDAAEKGNYESVPVIVRNYGIESGKVWQVVRESMPNDLVD